jgi:hypothetical protein
VLEISGKIGHRTHDREEINMATQISSFAPASFAWIVGSSTPATVAIPTTGTPQIALVTNTGNAVGYINFGASVSPSNGLAVTPGTTIPLTIGSNTQISGVGSTFNISFGS